MKKTTLTGLLLLVLSTNLLAEPPSFNFMKYGYSTANVDDVSPTLTGVDWNASLNVFDNFFVTGSYFKVDAKNTDDKLEMRTYGIGYQYDFSDSTALYSAINGVFIDPDGNENHEKGFELVTGIRNNFNRHIELNAAIEVVNTKTYDMVTFVAGAAYNFNNYIAIYSDFSIDKEYNRLSLGGRISF